MRKKQNKKQTEESSETCQHTHSPRQATGLMTGAEFQTKQIQKTAGTQTTTHSHHSDLERQRPQKQIAPLYTIITSRYVTHAHTDPMYTAV